MLLGGAERVTEAVPGARVALMPRRTGRVIQAGDSSRGFGAGVVDGYSRFGLGGFGFDSGLGLRAGYICCIAAISSALIWGATLALNSPGRGGGRVYRAAGCPGGGSTDEGPATSGPRARICAGDR